MKNKKIIIISIVVLLVIAIISFTTVTLLNKNTKKFTKKDFSNYDVNSIENKTRQVIDSVNYVNQLFNNQNFDTSTNFNNEHLGITCSKYTGENPEIFINVLRTIYEDPFKETSNFSIKKNGTIEELYVCKPTCSVKELLFEEVSIKDKNKDNTKITIQDKEYDFKKINDIWKLEDPIVLCEED